MIDRGQWQVAGSAPEVYERELVSAVFGPWTQVVAPRRRSTRSSTRRKNYSPTSAARGSSKNDPAKGRRLLATLFDRVWQDGGTIVAVKPREAFLRHFQTADELARRREKKRGVKSGSDGTRTRDLRRDRPARRDR